MPILARQFIAPLATNDKRKHNAKTVPLLLGCRQCENGIPQTQNRKTLPENRNTNPKTEINIPKRKHVQKNTKLKKNLKIQTMIKNPKTETRK